MEADTLDMLFNDSDGILSEKAYDPFTFPLDDPDNQFIDDFLESLVQPSYSELLAEEDSPGFTSSPDVVPSPESYSGSSDSPPAFEHDYCMRHPSTSYSDSGLSDPSSPDSGHSRGYSGSFDSGEAELETIDFNNFLNNPQDQISTEIVIGDDMRVDLNVEVSSEDESMSEGWQRNSKAPLLPFTVRDARSQESSEVGLPLTQEEMTLLAREGYTLPTNMPLTKSEEKVLKIVRRKIRNKQSAQVSREKKKVYVKGIEQRVELCTKQNSVLTKRVLQLENENKSLLTQLKRLQTYVTSASGRPAKTSTCIMVLAISFSLFLLPSFHPLFSSSGEVGGVAKSALLAGNSRSLLQVPDNVDAADITENYADFSSISDSSDPTQAADYQAVPIEAENETNSFNSRRITINSNQEL